MQYRGVLSTASAAPRVYLACSADGFAPCLEDDSAGEQLKWLGGVNVAGTHATAPRRPLTIHEIKALAPRAIVVTGGPGVAARLPRMPRGSRSTRWRRVASTSFRDYLQLGREAAVGQ